MNAQLTTRLRHLRLSGIVDALPGRAAQAEAAPLPHLEFLELLVADELARRADRLFARRLKQAGITVVQDARDFEWSFNPKMPKAQPADLAHARFVATHALARTTNEENDPALARGYGARRYSRTL